MRLLLVEDDISIAKLTVEALKTEGIAVDHTALGKIAAKWARYNQYDGAILDIRLPDINGIEVLKDIRAHGKLFPIMMLTGIVDPEEATNALQQGADDYVRKPFSFREVIARIRALQRRQPSLTPSILECGNLKLNINEHRCFRDGFQIYLSHKEFAILEYLILHQSQAVSRADILEHVWDQNADPFTNTIDVHIRNLRKKIDADFSNKIIHTVPKIGYQLSVIPPSIKVKY